MIYVLGILFGFIVFCIIALVLLQEGKGGGIAAMGGAAMDSLVGARNPLRKLTVIFSIIFLILVVGINVYLIRQGNVAVPKGLVEPPKVEAPVEMPVDGAASDAVPADKDAPATDADAKAPAGALPDEADWVPPVDGEKAAPQPATPEAKEDGAEAPPAATPPVDAKDATAPAPAP